MMLATQVNRPALITALAPTWLRDFCHHVAASKQVDADLVVINLLGAICSAVNGKLTVKRANGHDEPVQLFLMPIAEPGERKSSVVKLLKGVVAEELKMLKAKKQGPNRIFFEDVTGKGLKDALAANAGSLSCFSAEPELLNIATDRRFPFTLLCGGYDAEEIIVDRAREEPVIIPDPAVSLCVSSQLEVALDFARAKGVKGSGLRGRFLFHLPTPKAGTRTCDGPAIPEESLQKYRKLLNRFLSFEKSHFGRFELNLSLEAEALFSDYARQAEIELQSGRLLNFDVGWGSKFPGKVLRLAGLLHCVYEVEPMAETIKADTVIQAIRLGDVFVEHAREFLMRADFGEAEDIACTILQWVRGLQVQHFDTHDAATALPAFSKRQLQSGVNWLLETSRIRMVHSAEQISLPRGRGRPKVQRYTTCSFPLGPMASR